MPDPDKLGVSSGHLSPKDIDGECKDNGGITQNNQMILRIEIVGGTSRKFILEDPGKGKKIGEKLSRCKF